MSDIISRTYEVGISHTDNRNIARPSFLFHIMQDAATVHAADLGIDHNHMNIIWVLSRMKVFLKRPLLPYEQVVCQTWCPGIKGVSWYRNFTFFVGEEEVGHAVSMWVTLDPDTHRMLRPASLEGIESYLNPAEGSLPESLPKLEGTDLSLHHVHLVRYSDLDVNSHVNNAKIVDIISDALDLQDSDKFVSEMQVNYTSETVCGQALSLFSSNIADNRFICGKTDEKSHFESSIVLSPIG